MRKYLTPEIEISKLNPSDVIATSTHVDGGFDSGLVPAKPKAEETVY